MPSPLGRPRDQGRGPSRPQKELRRRRSAARPCSVGSCSAQPPLPGACTAPTPPPASAPEPLRRPGPKGREKQAPRTEVLGASFVASGSPTVRGQQTRDTQADAAGSPVPRASGPNHHGSRAQALSCSYDDHRLFPPGHQQGVSSLLPHYQLPPVPAGTPQLGTPPEQPASSAGDAPLGITKTPTPSDDLCSGGCRGPAGPPPSDCAFRAPPRALLPSPRTSQSGSGASSPSERPWVSLTLPGKFLSPSLPTRPWQLPQICVLDPTGGRGGTQWWWPEWQKVPRRRPSPGGEHKGSPVLPDPRISCGRLADSPAGL